MRRILALGFILIGLCSLIPATSHAETEATIVQVPPQIVMLIPANAFRDEEFELPYKIFASHATVTVASTRLGPIDGMMGLKANAEIFVKDIDVDKLDGLVLVGGVGARQYWRDPAVHRLVREVVAKEKVLAAICIAPVTLAYSGVLKGKNATVFVSERGRLIQEGARYTGKDLTVDGLIITASGPKFAQVFGERVLRMVLAEHRKRYEAALKAAKEAAERAAASEQNTTEEVE
ncbi:MAG: DJ-1/PfpI family protein [Candidatus Coatesbacteria bacterium]|nr:DJ-1/PfpI family protein [Candidatus Coatesbacteria bacterium]